VRMTDAAMNQEEAPEGSPENAEEEEEPEPERRLEESTLWKEDVFNGNHRAVWGSLYKPETKQWGYACCRSFQKEGPCSAAEEAAAAEAARKKQLESSEDYSTDSDDVKDAEQQLQRKPIDWSNPPTELLPGDQFKKAAEFIEHFVRFAVGAWQQQQDRGFSSFEFLERQHFEKTLKDTIDGITPLVRRLRRGDQLERGERKEGRSRCRETRTSMEGKFLGEAKVMDQLQQMAQMAYERDYVSAHKAYMRLTLGNKTWNNTCVQHVAACTMKGAREYRRNRDNLNTYDVDPISQRYMHALRKLVHFTQIIRKSPDESKNLVL